MNKFPLLAVVYLLLLITLSSFRPQPRFSFRGTWKMVRQQTVKPGGRTLVNELNYVDEYEFLQPNVALQQQWSVDANGKTSGNPKSMTWTFQHWRDTLKLSSDRLEYPYVYQIVSQDDSQMVWRHTGAQETLITFRRIR